MFLDTLKEKYGIKLNEQQQQAVRHINGPALILAGPGSGKTTVITVRTAYLIYEAGVNPESILTLTFNKAAQLEMKKRFDNIFGEGVGAKVKFLTLHGFSNGIVRKYEKKHGKNLTRIEGDDDSGINKRQILRTLYQQINGSNINDDELDNLINEIGFVKNRMIKEFKDADVTTKNFELVYKAYEDYKKSNLYIDFDDMLTYAYSILKTCPDILHYCRSKYRYIQVDEGQDLSRIQFEILKLLVTKENNNIFIVADDDQSIYGFRGADPQYILDIRKEFRECSVYRLEKNYRSTRNIVEISSKFIKNNSRRYDKNHETVNEPKNDPDIVYVQDENEQLKFIVETLNRHMKECRSTAVLYRNNISSIAIADMLDRKGIPFKVKQSRLFFFNHWMVQDVLAFLKFALNPFDEESFSRICFKMNRYISKAMLDYALSNDLQKPVLDRILNCEVIKPYQQRVAAELKNEFGKLLKSHPLQVLKYIEHNFRYFESVKQYCEKTGLCFDYIYSLFGVLLTVAEKCPTIPMFLQRMEELQKMLENAESPGYKRAVTLSTMHSSKGLEYDVVLMVDLTEEEIPGTRATELVKRKQDYSILEEERRLFYVGMTRAKEYLYLVSPAVKNRGMAKISPFIREVASVMSGKTGEAGEGVIVNHKHFGEGVIVAVTERKGEGILLEVDFGGVRRKLDFSICMKNGLISF
ncbi:MAG TPA: ATP-dependent helicase [Thermoclostridium sp.]